MEGPASASFTDGMLATGVISTSRQLALLRNCSDMAALSAQIRGMSPAAAPPATPNQSHYTLPPTPVWGGGPGIGAGGRAGGRMRRYQLSDTPSKGHGVMSSLQQHLQVRFRGPSIRTSHPFLDASAHGRVSVRWRRCSKTTGQILLPAHPLSDASIYGRASIGVRG